MIWLLACTDPALEPLQQSLSAYEKGKTALAAGHHAEAQTQFDAALQKDPQSNALVLWKAKAYADAGDWGQADAVITQLIQQHPQLGIAWYNRAAWRARAGHPVEAAQDLGKALELGASTPLRAAADPDFMPYLSHPAFATVLPPAPVVAKIQGPEGAVFVGSRFDITFTIRSLPEIPISIHRQGSDPGCLKLLKVIEDHKEVQGELLYTIRATLEAVQGCSVALGPWAVAAAQAQTVLPTVQIQVEQPASMPTPAPPPPLATLLPLLGGLKKDQPQPDAEGVAVRVDMGRSLSAGGRRPDVALELRMDGQSVAAGGWWRGQGPLNLDGP